jgi:sugar/nucleoside kinase (ribokinase family)
MKKVHCLGVVVVDVLSGPFKRYPQLPKRLQVISSQVRMAVGGGAANSASALGQMGIPVSIFSKIGNDEFGKFVLSELQSRQVNTRGIAVASGQSTPFTFVGIHPGGERSFIHTPGANLTFHQSDLDEKKLLNADFLVYQDFWVLPKLDGKPAAALLEKAQKRGVITVLDECWGLGPDRKKLETVLPFVDYFLPSFDDLASIYKGVKPAAMVDLLKAKGVKNVVLKMGRKGCLLSSETGFTLIPSRATKIVDATGAGDAFDAGFIAGLVQGLSNMKSAIMGSHAAAACISQVGGSSIVPLFRTRLFRK